MSIKHIFFATGLFTASAVFLAHPASVQAQSLELGIKAGAGFNQTSGPSLEGDFKGNFLGGVYGGVRLAKLKIQVEALFSQTTMVTGSSFNSAFHQYINESAQGVKEGTFKLNELSIPLTVGIRVAPKVLWAELGVQYTGVVSVKDVNSFLKASEDVFKNGYMSALVGVRADLPFKLNVGARYVYGLSNRNNSQVDEKWGTSQIQIHVGYSFLR